MLLAITNWLSRWPDFWADEILIRIGSLTVKLNFAVVVSQDQWFTVYQERFMRDQCDISTF